ncbi:hypothetical protein L5M36_03085 [Shewanella sp. SM72]|uniref:hypothetical protein n=1 Tax=Shewanella sp. SM72 TaxID=2912805 RepID=UPI0021DB5C6C|nr:hypothetical protein [Shewanella sp. SM72]MCU8015882.1 hypothetical protein [Shewanella sp. SM72]
MSDNVDDANKLADLHLNIALAKRDLPAPRAVTGVCHWCEDPVDGVVFCDADCRDDFEREQRRTKR